MRVEMAVVVVVTVFVCVRERLVLCFIGLAGTLFKTVRL